MLFTTCKFGEDIEDIKTGMSTKAVIGILGEPIFKDTVYTDSNGIREFWHYHDGDELNHTIFISKGKVNSVYQEF